LDALRAILREGPVRARIWPHNVRDGKLATVVMQMMPEPLWSAGAHEALAGDSKAVAADFGLAIRYCRSMLPNPDSVPNAWMFTIQAVRECAENHKLDRAGCASVLAELPEVSAIRAQVAEKFKGQLALDIAQVANMEVPYRKIQGEYSGFVPRMIPPCGTLDREVTVKLLIEFARGDVANVLGSRATFSNVPFERVERLTAVLPKPLKFGGLAPATGAYEAWEAKFVERMNKTPNSLGLRVLHANGRFGFTMDWQFEEQLEAARQALAVGAK
jgi:hypothetical protein